ncbi:hypothetical protein LCGC14_2172780 [marine sediment metagenome]|uniref:Uncharacterized protein n=1 Tax=marine sediment metagenome TaxID=412755 RepID=A0A0F9DPN9_9ZZZZ
MPYTLRDMKEAYRVCKNILAKCADADRPLTRAEAQLIWACEGICTIFQPFLLQRRCLRNHQFSPGAPDDAECPGCLEEIREVRAREFASLPKENGRPRIYASNGARQRAFRLRQRTTIDS